MKKILCLLLPLCLLLGMSACSTPTKESAGSPDVIVKDWWAATMANDSEKASSYWSSKEASTTFFDVAELGVLGDSEATKNFVTAYKSKFSLDILGQATTSDGDATVTATVTQPNLSNIKNDPDFYTQYLNAYSTGNSDDLAELLTKYMEKVEMVDVDYLFTLSQVDGVWKINSYQLQSDILTE